MMNNRGIIVFSRIPQKGRVKRRLALELGEDKAYYIFEMLFLRCLEEVAPLPVRRFLCLTPTYENHMDILKSQWPIVSEFKIFFQEGTDLGERMKSAFKKVFYSRIDEVILVGTDIPVLKRGHILCAFEMLKKHHLVVGPCVDGGYYLIGFKKDIFNWPSLFKGMPWGSDEVLESTLSKARSLGVEPVLLELLYDIDVKDDLARWVDTDSDNALLEEP